MPTSKPEAKENIKHLVERYEQVKKSRQRPKYDEANTRKDFIMPLFQALGWDIHNDVTEREVVEEADAIKGRVDYSFRINDIPQFLLEAKSLKTNLEKPEWAKQAVTYGWNKGIPWVVLTNFEKLKLFNSEWKVAEPKPNLDLSCQNYLEKFDYLWLLSKEASKTNELDKLLSQFGITAKRVNVNEKLAEDLIRWRDTLTNNLKQWNAKINVSDLEEAVQRILDRLIFIRVVEDRGIEEKILWQTFQKWEVNKHQPNNFLQVLIPIFRNFDKGYNSNLFQTHLCEKLETEGDPFQKIIPELYGDRETGVKYRFDAIGADVLGNVYEQYLGHVQQREGEESKRKKQGIYYTPTYIVDYIVQNTLGVALKEKSLREAENIKILDPACGSGSFLIKAFEVLDKHLKEEKSESNAGPEFDALRRFNILKENIYGVDLDSQAIEIARLNLILKALVPGQRLPLLTEHMRVGNSLISGTEKELKKYFGKDYQNKKPVNWDEEFKEVFDQGGFDVIIGNPPWVTLRHDELGREMTAFLKSKYHGAAGFKLNLFPLFVERCVQLTRNGGYIGLIIPNRLLDTPSYRGVRELILQYCTICEIVNIPKGAFAGVVAGNIILILEKRKPGRGGSVKVTEIGKDRRLEIPITQIVENENLTVNINTDPRATPVIEKINNSPTNRLKEVCDVHVGMMIRNKKGVLKDSRFGGEKIVLGRDFSKYATHSVRGFNASDVEIFGGTKDPHKHKTTPKLLVRKTGNSLVCSYDDQGIFAEQSVYLVLPKEKQTNLLFLLALINSKLLNFYFKNELITNPEAYPYVQHYDLENLPIYKIDSADPKEKSKQNTLTKLARRMLELNKDLQKCAKDSDKYRAIQAEIDKVDKQIDQLVYKLYDLTAGEIKIVEDSCE